MEYLFRNYNSFHNLSLNDLMGARNQYHPQLTSKAHVVATAIGKHRFKKDKTTKGEKTFSNTEIVHGESYPCILVLVDEWADAKQFSDVQKAAELVPPFLHMQDGRVVPTCVIKIAMDTSLIAPLHDIPFSNGPLGAGSPIVVESQGAQRMASVGCLVTDGHSVYALTNNHVAGAKEGTPVYTVINGKQQEIGFSSSQKIRHVPFSRAYPQWNQENTLATVDVGLIELYDVTRWTSEIPTMGPMGKLIDLDERNFTLKLLGAPVQGFGGASGLMQGTIHGLFYRYKEAGGKEFTADFLIGRDENQEGKGKKKNKRFTQPGDSGTVWFIDTEKLPHPADEKPYQKVNMPIAIQWGGQSITQGDSLYSSVYALASSLSTALNILDLELVLHQQSTYYWGATGHYMVAYQALEAIKDGNLKQILQDHLEAMTFPKDKIEKNQFGGRGAYAPLADVPDLMWKSPQRKPTEGVGHHVDMDVKVGPNGETMAQRIERKPELATDIDAWIKYYTDGKVNATNRGTLQFRVWQLYDIMVDYVEKGKVTEFIATAGILAHYLGDACQPLHCSENYDGIAGTQPKRGKGVHAAYETDMVKKHSATLLGMVDNNVTQMALGNFVNNGKEAAVFLIDLVKRCSDKMPPLELAEYYASAKEEANDNRGVLQSLWDEYGEKTAENMADGAVSLATLWESAWKQGNGKRNLMPKYNGEPLALEEFTELCRRDDFLQAYRLADLKGHLKIPRVQVR